MIFHGGFGFDIRFKYPQLPPSECQTRHNGAKALGRGAGRNIRRARISGKSAMSAGSDEKVGPVKPERLHQALGIYQMALADKQGQGGGAPAPSGSPAEPDSVRGMRAVKRDFPDAAEFEAISVRLKHFTEVLGDKKLIKWGMVKHSEGGIEIHDAVVNALASAPFRKSGVLDKTALHALVKAEYNRLEAEEKK